MVVGLFAFYRACNDTSLKLHLAALSLTYVFCEGGKELGEIKYC